MEIFVNGDAQLRIRIYYRITHHLNYNCVLSIKWERIEKQQQDEHTS